MNYLKEILFPRRCPVCDNIVGGLGRIICERCYRTLKPLSGELCCKCGKKLRNEETEYCRDCSRYPHFFDSGMALYGYEDVAACLYRFKYQNRQEYADFFGREMACRFRDRIRTICPDGLVPVPLYKKREQKRGYNQAELLAEVVGRELGLPVYPKMIVRQRNTLPQKNLNSAERQNNLKRAFKIVQNEVKLSTIIIIDDIYTTGSTIDAVSEVLRQVGTEKIFYLTLAIGRER